MSADDVIEHREGDPSMSKSPSEANGPDPGGARERFEPQAGSSLDERFEGPALARVLVDGVPRLALWRAGRLLDLSGRTTLDQLLARRRSEIFELLEDADELPPIDGDVAWLAPCESQEVWAAGVTYLRSREARMDEAEEKDFYARVYEADRPELFFKAAGWRVVPHGGEVGYRSDSSWNVPEPELAVLVNRFGEIVAVACGNDVSSRQIEGENPLYLPQAKTYDLSCSLGPVATLVADPDAPDSIEIEIERAGSVVYAATTSTEGLVRPPSQLVAVLTSAYSLPVGGWLMTGTALVPPNQYTMQPGDEIRITVGRVGTLVNRVRMVEAAPLPRRAVAEPAR
jgi:2-dehydro-3-deoxy-D-arabinonate dehydratase